MGEYIYLDEIIKGRCLLVADMHLKYTERIILVSYQEYSELIKTINEEEKALKGSEE
jgi:metallophosphoesterase superfamily enzyme